MIAHPYKLGIIEDNQVIRETLCEYFRGSQNFSLHLVVGSGEEYLEKFKEQRIDLLLCDIGLPGKSGIDMTWYIKRKWPSTQVVMYTVFDDKEAVFQALCAGASGYLLKTTPLAKIEEQLMEVMNGGSVMSPHVARMVIGHFNPFLDGKPEPYEKLTPREIEIVSMLQEGLSYRETGERLHISVDTVKYHVRNIYSKLHINSRAELINRYKGVF